MGGPVRVRLLGTFEVEGVDRLQLGSRKARTLLKVLAVARGGPVGLDRLADVVWEGNPPERRADQVAVLVSRLRGVLGQERIVRVEGGYALRADSVDLDTVEELAAEARRRLASGAVASARAAADAAQAMLRGPLLADEPEAGWAAVERAAAERLAAGVRHLAAETALAAGDATAAAAVAERALDHDPYDEVALRLGLAALAAGDRRAAALALYERARERIADDLGVDPAAATLAAHLAVLQGRPVPGIEVGARPALEASPGTAPEGLPGRETDLGRLDAALGRARAEGFQLVAVEGEAGIGKTRLLDAWAWRARAGDATVLQGRADELGRTLSLQPVLDALITHLRSLDPDAAAALLGGDAALLAPFLDLPAPAAEHAGLAVAPDAAARQSLLFGALAGLLERLATAAPVVLLLDDLHLAGEATFAWLGFLRRRPPRGPVLAIAARRPEEGPPLAGAEVLRLGPLDRAAIAVLVGTDSAEEVEARTGGNALLVVELARAGPEAPLPQSLLEVVSERCERAGAAAATTLRTAAVLGPSVDLELLGGVLDASPATLLDHLEEGVRRHFLDVRDAGFVFRHTLVREAMVAGTTAPRRALVNRRAARILAARPGADPLAVAYLARSGGDEDLETEACIAAAAIADRRYDHAEADRLLSRAVALRPGADALLRRALVRIAGGRYREAGEDAMAALARGAGPEGFEVAGSAAYYARDFAAARTLAGQGLRLAEAPDTRAALLLLAGRERHAVGELATADSLMAEAMETASTAGAAVPSVWLAALRVHQGRPDEALRVTGVPLEATSHASHLFAAPHVHFTRALALGGLGRPRLALDELDRLDELVERRQTTRFLGRGENARGWLLRNLGSLSEADEWNRRGLEASGRIAYAEAQAHSLLDLAEGRLWAGELDAARRLVAEVAPLRTLPQAFAWRHGLRARLLLARLDLLEGRPPEAAAAAEEVAEDADAHGALKYRLLGRLVAARARAAAGERLDPASLEGAVRGLEGCAAMEAWWLTAEAAAAHGVDAWWELAAARAAALAEAAGERGDGLRRHAARHLERLRSGALRPRG